MRRKLSGRVVVLLSCVLACSLAAVVSADPASTSDAAKVSEKVQRLPHHFGKLGLSDEQKEKVFAIQAKYDVEIQALKERLKKLQGEEQAEFRAVLTKEQLSRMELLKSESRKKPGTTSPLK